ncbi:cation efflux family-domain-containing protein [Dichotomocladium elegans]|nr:cation efflux family-domain-containing protein [Dichotomocladium elegans]
MYVLVSCSHQLLSAVRNSEFELPRSVKRSGPHALLLSISLPPFMFSSSALDLPSYAESAELGFGKSLAFDASSTSAIGFLKHSLSIILDNQDSKQIFYFLLLNLSYMFVQLAYGVWTNSLGLISDAIHMFFDCLALAVGLFASVMSKWPPNPKYSYGYNRIETVAAFFNSVFLVLISVSIVVEGIQRIINPPEMNTQRLLLVSFVGLVVNLVGIFAFNHGHAHGHGGHDHGHGHGHGHGHDHHHGHSANMQGVFLHILADTLGSVGVIVSTLLIQWFGWTGFDPIASLFIAILIVLSVLPLIKQSSAVLMLELEDNMVYQVEGTLNELRQLKGVAGIFQPRFWPNEAETLVGSLHVQAHDGTDLQELRRRVSELLMSHIDGLKEVCVQVESQSAARARISNTSNNNTSNYHQQFQPNGAGTLGGYYYNNNNNSHNHGFHMGTMNYRSTPVAAMSGASPLPPLASLGSVALDPQSLSSSSPPIPSTMVPSPIPMHKKQTKKE